MRSGKSFYPKAYGDDNYIYEGSQGGSMNIVFGTSNDVYIQDPVYGFVHETFVKGTLSEDGKKITVPLPQVLYQYDNGEKVLLAVGKFIDEEKIYKIDKDVKEVVYMVEDDKDNITLQLFDKQAPLGNFWSEDSTFAGRGEWETVLTKYVEKTEVVEITEEEEKQIELSTVKRALGGAYWVNGSFQFVNDSINVATWDESDTIIVQGMVPMLPNAWVRGIKKNGVVTFPVQLLDIQDGKKYFLAGLSGDGTNMSPFMMYYDEKLKSYTADSRLIVNSSDLRYNESTVYGYYTGVYVGERPTLVQLPENITANQIISMPYDGTFDNGANKTPIAGVVNVVFDGENIYIQGLVTNAPQGWLKGQLDNEHEDVYFNLGQYVGYDAYGNIYAVGDKSDMKGYLDALSESVDDPAKIRLSFDSENQSFRLVNNLYGSRKADEIDRDYVIRAGLTINEGTLWVAAKQGYENASDVSEVELTKGVKATFDKAENGSNAPKYYNGGTAVRMYAGNALTISSDDKVIGKVAFIFDIVDKVPMLEAQDGDFFIADSMGIWTGDASQVTFDVINASGNQARIKSIMVFYFDYANSIVALPDFVTIQPYQMTAMFTDPSDSFSEPTEIKREVKVGFKGNDIYFQGLSEKIPEAWVKGKLSNGKVTVPNWYMGTFESEASIGLEGEVTNVNLNFSGSELVYDAETRTFTSDGYKTQNPDAYSEWDLDVEEFASIVLTKLTEVATVPATPSVTDFVGAGNERYVAFTVPAVDAEGKTLFTDKLSYIFLIEKEEGNTEQLTLSKDLYEFDADYTEIPYDFTDGIYIQRKRVALLQNDAELQSWKKIGIQSIYRGANVENESEVYWLALGNYWKSVGIDTQIVSEKNATVGYFDLLGRTINTLGKGLFVKQVRLEDGTIKYVKVLRR